MHPLRHRSQPPRPARRAARRRTARAGLCRAHRRAADRPRAGGRQRGDDGRRRPAFSRDRAFPRRPPASCASAAELPGTRSVSRNVEPPLWASQCRGRARSGQQPQPRRTSIMDIRVSGHQVDTGEALQEHATERLTAIVEKYFSRALSSQVTFGKAPAGRFRCDIVMHVKQGLVLKGARPGAGRAPGARSGGRQDRKAAAPLQAPAQGPARAVRSMPSARGRRGLRHVRGRRAEAEEVAPMRRR